MSACGESPTSVARVTELRAEVSLPFRDDERATMALRGDLRLRAVASFGGPLGQVTVTGPVEEVDDQGRTWWRWTATVDRPAN